MPVIPSAAALRGGVEGPAFRLAPPPRHNVYNLAMPALKDIVRCPTCGSHDIVYTCEPKCCYNHLCSDCRTTFQLVTHRTTRTADSVQLTAGEPPSGDPTAACAACESLKLAVTNATDPPLLVCCSCQTSLDIAYEDIAPDTR
jgi:hypothetical protein